jgi:cell division protein FtsB
MAASPSRAQAAADLICNLDKALFSAQASSLTAKDDAERARRNAKAAGEVARRYGGQVMKKKANTAGEGGGRSLLDMKRERRSRARMAAEARQRREYEMSAAVLDSARGDWGVASNAISSKEGLTDLTDAVTNARDESNELEEEIHHRFGVSNETISTTDGTVSTMEFEDALDSYPLENVKDGDDGGNGATTNTTESADHDASYDYNQSQAAENAAHSGQYYYDQQRQYSNEQQQQDGQYYYDQQRQYYDEQQQQDGQYSYQYTGDPQNYYNQDGSQTTDTNQTASNINSFNTPNRTNKSETATPIITNHSLAVSNAEDVLALSLELERVRAQLTTTTHNLNTSQSQMSTLQDRNSDLQAELNRLNSELETIREHSESEVQSFSSKYNAQLVRANAAEEDATVALELAKDATAAKEECEEWLGRSMEEIELWKSRCGELERQLVGHENRFPIVEDDETRKVRFALESPASPVVGEDGSYKTTSPSPRKQPRGAIPPPPPPPAPPLETQSTEAGASPHATPNRSSIASGRALLCRASPGPSPQQKAQIKDLLKRTTETRRILKERIATPTKQPPSLAIDVTSNGSASVIDEDGFASRQGAACRSIGKTIRDSGIRLNLEGKWFVRSNALMDGSSQPAIEVVAELESMVGEYCDSVESKIGSQNEKIDELLAFCDHLEKELLHAK